MKIGSVINASEVKKVSKNIVPSLNKSSDSNQVVRSVRDEVILRRKKQKSFGIIDIIKNNLENKINEKIKDYLGIRFDFS